MHDCCHCIYFALPSSYHSQEVTLGLPCENDLWQADTAADWYTVLQRPSPYGTTQASRLAGMCIPKMMAYLSETRTIPAAIPQSAFAHFVLIHIILKQLFLYCVGGKPPGAKPGAADEMDPEMFKLQFSLHNWLQNWRNSPDSRTEAGPGEPPFIQNCTSELNIFTSNRILIHNTSAAVLLAWPSGDVSVSGGFASFRIQLT